MGQNIFHLYFRQRVNIQNLQIAVDIKYQGSKTANQQIGKQTEYILLHNT